MKTIDIAQVCHEANRVYCESIGDNSQLPWAEAPDWQKESAINGVEHAEDPGAGPGDSHRCWLQEKKLSGWTWGPVKNPALKQHPCMVPFDELPPEQQMKDVLFLAVARSLMEVGG